MTNYEAMAAQAAATAQKLHAELAALDQSSMSSPATIDALRAMKGQASAIQLAMTGMASGKVPMMHWGHQYTQSMEAAYGRSAVGGFMTMTRVEVTPEDLADLEGAFSDGE